MEEKKIILSADTGEAVKSIEQLSETIGELRGNLSAIKDIADKIDLSNINPGINEISKGINKLNTSLTKISGVVPKLDFTPLDAASKNIQALSAALDKDIPGTLSKIASSLSRLNKALEEFNNVAKLEAIKATIKDISEYIDSFNGIKTVLDLVSAELKKSGKSFEDFNQDIDKNSQAAAENKKQIDQNAQSIRSIRQEIRQYESDVISAAEGTSEQTEAIVRLNEAYDRLEVAQVNVRNRGNDNIKIVQNTISVTRQLASTFSIVQSALSITGSESKELNKIFVQLQATIALVQGLQGLAGFPRTLKNLRQSFGAATISVQSFNAALKANPVGVVLSSITLLVAAITTAVGIFRAFKKANEEVAESIDEVSEATERVNKLTQERKEQLQEQLVLLEMSIELESAAGANEEGAIKRRIDFYNEEIAKIVERNYELHRTLDIVTEEGQKEYEANKAQIEEYSKVIDNLNFNLLKNQTKAQYDRLTQDRNYAAEQKKQAESLSNELENVFLDSYEVRRKNLLYSYEKDRQLLVSIYGENSDQVFNLEYRLQQGITQIQNDEQNQRLADAKQFIAEQIDILSTANDERLNLIDSQAKDLEVKLSEYYLRLEEIRKENGDTEEVLQQIAETELLLQEKTDELRASNIQFLVDYESVLLEQLSLETTTAEQRALIEEQLTSNSIKLATERANQQIAQNKRETDNLQKEENTREKIRKLASDREKAYLDVSSSIASSVADLLGEQTAAGKAAAIAAATIDTYKAANSAYSSLAGIPIVGPGLGAAAAAAAIVSGIANVKKIVSTSDSGTSGGLTSSVPSSVASTIPTVPNIEDYYQYEPIDTTPSYLDSTEERRINQRVYVVESDISDALNTQRVRISDSDIRPSGAH